MNAPNGIGSDVKDLMAKIKTAETPTGRNAAIRDLVVKIEAKHGDAGLDMLVRAIHRVNREEREGRATSNG